jgi:hypothetical protein
LDISPTDPDPATPPDEPPASEPATAGAVEAHAPGDMAYQTTMLPQRRTRPPLESAFVRVVATGGVIGIGVALGAILTSQHVAGWITGLAVATVSVLISAVLWSSRGL